MLRDPGPTSDAAVAFARELGVSFTAAEWFLRRGSTLDGELQRWLEPKLAHLTPPYAMADLAAAVDRLAHAIRSGERIAVFGDYDCDGITACAIVTEVTRALGGEATPLIASRFEGGYGFSATALARVLDTRATLLVTCDCGSTDHERLEAAKQAGIDTVVIDHHIVPDQELPALAFLNPHRPVCGFPYKGLASCGLGLLVAAALRKTMGRALDLRPWLDLVAVGTIADVAPLTGDNRVLVRRGLEVLSAGARVGLAALALNGNGGRKRAWSSEDVAYQIAPRLNAAGRLTHPRLSLEVLLERDATRAWQLAAEIEQLTVRRREIQRAMIDEALRDIERCGYQDDPSLLLARQGWHPGVVGIVAGRLADQFRRPAIVVALEGESGRGSARAPAGFRLYDSLAACRAELVGFGGHQAAAGVELRTDRVERFRDVWRQTCAAQLAELPPLLPQQPDVRLDERDDLARVLGDFERIEPCGHQNPAPLLWIPDAQVLAAREVKGHLKLELRVRGQTLSGFAPNLAKELSRIQSNHTLALAARLKRDYFRGGKLPELLVVRFE